MIQREVYILDKLLLGASEMKNMLFHCPPSQLPAILKWTTPLAAVQLRRARPRRGTDQATRSPGGAKA